MLNLRSASPANPLGAIDLGEHDLYLSIAPEAMFDLYGIETHAPTVGSLWDDLAQLQQLRDDPQRTVTPVDIERLGNVLRAVARIGA